MDYSPEFEQAVRSVNPSVQPSQLAQVYGQMRQQFPDASEQDFADAVASAGVVSGKLPAQGMSPSVMQGVSEYQNAVQADQVVKQKQQELNGINQGLQTSQQNIAQLQQMIDNPTGPQDLVNAQNQVQQGRNQVGENIGHIIAALGGNGVSQNYQNFIAGKRRDEQQQIQNVKDRMGAEMQTLQFQKVKDEYIETRRAIAAKYKEDADRKDPNSQISVLTRKMYTAMAESNPALQKMIPNLETMSAAEIEKHGPLFKAMVDHADKKLTMDLKVQEQAAKSSLDMQRLAKLQAETEKVKAETARGGREAMNENQAASTITKVTEDIAKHDEALSAGKNSLNVIGTLKGAYKNTSTGPIVGSDVAMMGRRILPGGGDIQAIQNGEAELTASIAKTFGANPSDAETRLLKKVTELSKMDPAERDATLLRLEEAVNAKIKVAGEAKRVLEPVRNKAQSALGVQQTKPFVTMDQIRKAAREKGATEQEMIDHVTAKGYEVR